MPRKPTTHHDSTRAETNSTSISAIAPNDLREAPDGIAADWDLVKPKLREALENAFQTKCWPVYLFGDQGRGKTCAVAALCRRLNGHPMWIDAQLFVRMVQRCRTSPEHKIYELNPGHGHTEEQLFAKYMAPVFGNQRTLLMVDDIGIRRPSDSAFEIIYELVHRRRRLPAIYTSNLSPDRIAECYDSRVASRLLCGTVIELTGDDRRMRGVEILKV